VSIVVLYSASMSGDSPCPNLLYSTLLYCTVPCINVCGWWWFMLYCAIPTSGLLCTRQLYSTLLYSVSVTQSSQGQSNQPILLECSLLKPKPCICLYRSLHEVAMSCHVRLGNSELVRRRNQYNNIQTSYNSIAEPFYKLVREYQPESHRS